MEFPKLGTHCAKTSCSLLDFLPFECDACHKIFCKDHRGYSEHDCPEAYVKDARVPVCPLCDQPVPINRGEDPNIKMDEHIQKDCKVDEKKKKAYTNRCSFPACKKKELVPVKCVSCGRNFCLKHRFETDHNCEGHPQRLGGGGGGGNRQALESRKKTAATSNISRRPQQTTLSSIGAELNRERQQRHQERRTPSAATSQSQHMSSDEALARALAASMQGDEYGTAGPSSSRQQHHHRPAPEQTQPPQATGYDEDEALARAIAASLNDEQPKRKPRTSTNPQPSSRRPKKDENVCSIC